MCSSCFPVIPISDRVANGAALLDEKLPGWERQADFSDVDIASFHKCVLGKLFGHFDYGLAQTRLRAFQAFDYGFNTTYAEVSAINAEWKRVINERLSPVVQPKKSDHILVA